MNVTCVLARRPRYSVSTPRHCSRLLKCYLQSGPLGMNNQSRGHTGNRLLPASLTDQTLSIIRERYRDFGPTLAREKLEEIHGLVLGKETIRRLMIKAGLWIPRRQRAPKIHQPRYRRPCTGELIQIDGWRPVAILRNTVSPCSFTAIKPAYSESIISTPPPAPVKPSLREPCAASTLPRYVRRPARQRGALNVPT